MNASVNPDKSDAAPSADGALSPLDSEHSEIKDPTDQPTTQVTARKASVRADQLVLSTSPLPAISEMEWMKENCPGFLEAFQNDLLEESKHRRKLEEKGLNSSRFFMVLIFFVMMYSIHSGNAWAAATLLGAAALAYAGASFLLGQRSGSGFPNLTVENRGRHDNKEETITETRGR